VVAVLEIDGVSKSYGSVRALDGCTFTAAPKRLIGLLGPNGAGKTTLMRCLLGLVEPDTGTMRWCGAPITDRTRRRFGYLPEERGLYPSMAVAEQIRYFARLSGLTRSAASRATRTVIDRVELGNMSDRRVEQLSHGNQQRVQFAVALVHEPDVLILDEPFAGLDPLGVHGLGGLLRALTEDGTMVVFSSHQLDLVQHLCQDVITMDRGRVVLAGALDELQEATQRRHIDVVFARSTPPDWLALLPEVHVEGMDDRHVRLAVTASGELDSVLRAAQAAGPLLRFDFEPPSVEEMFREAIGR
jgi:ABC-2 type transport system ATP-binding protein